MYLHVWLGECVYVFGWGHMFVVCVCVCGLIAGQHSASTERADSSVEVLNNAEVVTGLFSRVKLK